MAEASEHSVREIATVSSVSLPFLPSSPGRGLTVTSVCFIRFHLILLALASSFELLGDGGMTIGDS
jgi:hypothetical protein